MKARIIVATVAICAAVIGVRCLIEYLHSPRRAAVRISMELARNMMESPGAKFKLINTSFLDSFDKHYFYVALDFKDPGAGDRLREVYYFDASHGQPRLEWSYSVLNNLTKLKVSEGAFVDDFQSRIQRKGQGFEMSIALTPVDWQYQAETIAWLGRHGVEMLVSIEEHPELKPLRIVNVNDMAECAAEFSSVEDALYCAKVLDIKVKK